MTDLTQSYQPGTNAFTAVSPKGGSDATKLPKKQAKRTPEQDLIHIRARMKKAATKVNKGDFHINTPAMDLASNDKRRKIISTSKGGQ